MTYGGGLKIKGLKKSLIPTYWDLKDHFLGIENEEWV